MTLLLRLIPVIFSEVSQSGIVCVFHELVKRPTIPAIESKQYVLSNLRGIINALCALEDNGLKNNHPLSVPLLARTQSISTYRIPPNVLPTFPEGAS